MKKTKILATLLVCMTFICSMLLTGCGKDDGKDVAEAYTLQISHIAASEDPINWGWEYLEDILEERTEGKIQVEIFGNKQLSNSNNEDFEKVMNNIVQATSVPTSTIASMADIKPFWVFEYPYLFESYDEFYKVMDSDIAKEWSQMVTDKVGVRTYGGYSLGWNDISTKAKQINTLADLKGQKIRTMQSDVQIAVVEALGASATVMNYGEVFTGCQQGTIDGIYTTTGLYVSDRFYEVQGYLACTNATSLLHVPCINSTWYDSLPAELQATFDECMAEYLEEVRRLEAEFDAKALQTLADNGMTIVKYDEQQIQEFKEATSDVIENYADIAGQDTIDAVKEILNK